MPTDEGPGVDWDAQRVTLGRHFLRDMESLWEHILRLAAVVEGALTNSVRALCEGRADLAAEVHSEEPTINSWEVEIERECLRILALHQPVASDLRRVATIWKINGGLERMADLADHIAKRARKLARRPVPAPIPHKLEVMALEALSEVHDALDALVKGDSQLARQVIAADRGVDRLRCDVLRELKQSIRREPEKVSLWLRLINTTRNLERIADHATNIAEAVIYLKEGQIIRRVSERRVAEPA